MTFEEREEEVQEERAAERFKAFAPALGNFSIQYNLSCAGIAIAVMKSCSDEVGKSCKEGDFPEPEWAKYLLLGTVFAGAVLGMLTMGYLGDVIGRRGALVITMSFTVAGALGSALLSWGDNNVTYSIIACCRFFLGVGVGGVYPLSATTSAESAKHDGHDSRRVGWAFFWQVPGGMAPYVVALCLLKFHQQNTSPSEGFVPQPGLTSFQFRVIMGLGALPAAVALWLTLKDHRMAEPEESHEGDSDAHQTSSGGVDASGDGLGAHDHHELVLHGSNPVAEALSHPVYFRLLLGTGGTWFLYDVAFYGTQIFLPQILDAIFETDSADPKKQNSLATESLQALLVTAVGVPGCIAAIMLIDPPRGPRWILVTGFATMALAFSLLALAFTYEATDNKLLVILLFAFVSFAMNFGPNVGTYVLPTQVYPAEVRSTFHGLSAGAGKLGAVVGTFIYEPISKQFGLPAVMWTQAGLCVLAVILSVSFLPLDRELQDAGEHPNAEEDEEQMDNQARPLLAAV